MADTMARRRARPLAIVMSMAHGGGGARETSGSAGNTVWRVTYAGAKPQHA